MLRVHGCSGPNTFRDRNNHALDDAVYPKHDDESRVTSRVQPTRAAIPYALRPRVADSRHELSRHHRRAAIPRHDPCEFRFRAHSAKDAHPRAPKRVGPRRYTSNMLATAPTKNGAPGVLTVTPVPYDPGSSQDLQMLEGIEGWSRSYGDRHIYVKRQSKKALSGTVEWSDVFLEVGNQTPVDPASAKG